MPLAALRPSSGDPQLDDTDPEVQEIALWFSPNELVSWKSAQQDWVYEKP